jgi:aryl-alcohol dehydrogenase-like predicted oxidoreductase
MQYIQISGTGIEASRVGLGTWAIGGWMWGGADERESIRTIHAAIEQGVRLIDTAPAYGFGRSEEIVGKAVAEYGHRENIVIATKVGLEWREGRVFPKCVPPENSSESRRFVPTTRNNLHRYLSSPLARAVGAHRGDSEDDAAVESGGQDSRLGVSKLFARANR